MEDGFPRLCTQVFHRGAESDGCFVGMEGKLSGDKPLSRLRLQGQRVRALCKHFKMEEESFRVKMSYDTKLFSSAEGKEKIACQVQTGDIKSRLFIMNTQGTSAEKGNGCQLNKVRGNCGSVQR